MHTDQHVPLRADRLAVGKRFAILFMPLFALVGGIIATLYYAQTSAARILLETEERDHLVLQSEMILSDFRSVVSDLLVLSASQVLRQLLDGGGLAEERALAEEYLVFADRKKVYDQIRFLDETGHEIVRINLVAGNATNVPKEQLQSKFSRYYFKETFGLSPGEVFVSPFDLNIESGVIEQPPKPTIRFGTPVFNSKGQRCGIVILNYLGAKLIDTLKKLSVDARGEVMLLNASGYWLYSPHPEDEWGFMYSDRRDRTFARAFPDAWRIISRSESGEFFDDTGLFLFETVYPMPARGPDGVEGTATAAGSAAGGPLVRSADYRWKIVSHVPSSVLFARSRRLLVGLARLYAVLAVGLAIGSWFLARFRADHQLADDALRESESRFRQMAENIDEVFWMMSADRRQMIYVSPAYEQIFGRSCQSLRERPEDWLDAIHPEDRVEAEDAIFANGVSGEFDVEYRIVRPDGTIRSIWDRGFPIRDGEGVIQRVTGIAEDTTATKEARQQVLQSERLAALGEAMAGLAHESRNALQRSRACLEMLVKRVKDRPEALALIERFQNAQHDLHRLYEQVRSYAAPVHLKCKQCELRGIFAETWSQLKLHRNGRTAVLREHGVDTYTECSVDPFAIKQAMHNILENALHAENDPAALRDPVEIDVTWSAGELHGEPSLSMVIRDNGPGLSAEQARRIFDPFYTTKSRGTGLGMAITKRIVEAHGGEVAVGGEPEAGAEIVLTLPRNKL